jgi:hypothetical protein
MPAAEDLFISEQHPISQRSAILEDDGRVAWLYLTEPGTQKPAADCWLYNRVATPPRFDSARGEAPVVPATHAASGATQDPPFEKSVHFVWSSDGESVAVVFESQLAGFIAHGKARGFSRNIRVSGPFGNVLDMNLYRNLFEEKG